MLIGIVVGTYSSLFIATPVLVDTMSKEEHIEIEKAHNA
jgi:SecD/SecF fusion protein